MYISSLALTFHVAREGAKLCRSLIESTIGRPKLLRETSRKSIMIEIMQYMIHGISIHLLRTKMNDLAHQSCEDVFDDVILPPPLKERVISIAKAARKVREHKAPHRHVLFYGPPGTCYFSFYCDGYGLEKDRPPVAFCVHKYFIINPCYA